MSDEAKKDRPNSATEVDLWPNCVFGKCTNPHAPYYDLCEHHLPLETRLAENAAWEAEQAKLCASEATDTLNPELPAFAFCDETCERDPGNACAPCAREHQWRARFDAAKRSTDYAPLFHVERETSARYLGCYEWVRNEAKAVHFTTREAADEAAKVASKSNGGVRVVETTQKRGDGQ